MKWMNFSRRSILKALGLSTLMLLSGSRLAMAGFFFRPKKSSKPRLRENPFARDGKALVGIAPVATGGVKGAVREAVSLIGGFDKLDIKGKTVLVKPNVVSGEKNPATTNPEVVSAVVGLMYEHGASKVYVADMSAFKTLSTKANMEKNGIMRAALAAGAEVAVFEDYGWVRVALPGNTHIKEAYVTEWVFRTDIIVNLPVIKTHRSASYSISLKNFIGCTHLKQRPYIVAPSHWEEVIAEFNAAYTPDINIVDGTVSMIEGGPWQGTGAPTGIIIASGDRVGADVAGLGVIKSFGIWDMVTEKSVWDQRQIKTAIALGAGRGRGELELLTAKGGEDFMKLMGKVRAEAF